MTGAHAAETGARGLHGSGAVDQTDGLVVETEPTGDHTGGLRHAHDVVAGVGAAGFGHGGQRHDRGVLNHRQLARATLYRPLQRVRGR